MLALAPCLFVWPRPNIVFRLTLTYEGAGRFRSSSFRCSFVGGAGFVVALCGEIMTMPGLPECRRRKEFISTITDHSRIVLSRWTEPGESVQPRPCAYLNIFSDSQRKPCRSPDHFAPAYAACRYDPSGGGRHLCLAAARQTRLSQDREDRAGGDGSCSAIEILMRLFNLPIFGKKPVAMMPMGRRCCASPTARARVDLRPNQRGYGNGNLPCLG